MFSTNNLKPDVQSASAEPLPPSRRSRLWRSISLFLFPGEERFSWVKRRGGWTRIKEV